MCILTHSRIGTNAFLCDKLPHLIKNNILQPNLKSGNWYKGGQTQPAHRQHWQNHKREYRIATPKDIKWKP